MIQYQFFPRSQGINKNMQNIIECFKSCDDEISSEVNNLNSNAVLRVLQPHLLGLGYEVEQSKAKADKIDVPVLYGLDNKIDKYYNADALSADGKVVIEIEAGRATENNQYMKDIFQACMMHGVEYLVVAVRNIYRGHRDFEIVYTFLETLYISSRLILPLRGILLIGY